MTDLKSPNEVGPAEPTATKPTEPKTIRPVLFWSSLGAVFVASVGRGQ